MDESPELTPRISAELLLDCVDESIVPPLVRAMLKWIANNPPPDAAVGEAMASVLQHIQPDATDADFRHWLLHHATVEQAYAIQSLLLMYRVWILDETLDEKLFVHRWKELLCNPNGVGVLRAAYLLHLKSLSGSGE